MLVENPVVITEEELMKLARQARGRITTIYLHWTAGHYGDVYDDYHLNIDADGTVYVTCKHLWEKKYHTWLRNNGTIGIALCCACGADCRLPAAISPQTAWGAVGPYEYRDPYQAMVDYGDEPPTAKQVETLAKIVAILCNGLNIANSSENVKTHCEIAFKDAYGPGSGDPQTKWDLWFLPDACRNGRLFPGGYLIRGKAAYYQWDMQREKEAA